MDRHTVWTQGENPRGNRVWAMWEPRLSVPAKGTGTPDSGLELSPALRLKQRTGLKAACFPSLPLAGEEAGGVSLKTLNPPHWCHQTGHWLWLKNCRWGRDLNSLVRAQHAYSSGLSHLATELLAMGALRQGPLVQAEACRGSKEKHETVSEKSAESHTGLQEFL